MALFKSKGVVCPICDAPLASHNNRDHWKMHIAVLPAGHGDLSGQYTWSCTTCGPAGTTWSEMAGATGGLAVHMSQHHSIGL